MAAIDHALVAGEPKERGERWPEALTPDDCVAAALVEADGAEVVGEGVEGERATSSFGRNGLGLREQEAARALPPCLGGDRERINGGGCPRAPPPPSLFEP